MQVVWGGDSWKQEKEGWCLLEMTSSGAEAESEVTEGLSINAIMNSEAGLEEEMLDPGGIYCCPR